MGFIRTISEGSKGRRIAAHSRAAGEARLMFIPWRHPWANLGLTVFGWGGLAAFVSPAPSDRIEGWQHAAP
jgi:hypothetical protein